MFRAKNKKNNKAKRVNRPQSQMRMSIPAPPSYDASSIVSRRFRFQYAYTPSSGTATFNISAAKLGALQVIGTVVNTTAVQLYEAVRIRKVELWASPTADSNEVDVAVIFQGATLGAAGANRQMSDTTIGMTKGAYVGLTPGKLGSTQASQWQKTDTNVGNVTLFTLIVSSTNTGATGVSTVTCDVHVALRITADARTTANSVTLTTVAVGAFYNLALDNPAGGTLSSANSWTPDRTLVTTT